MPTLIGNADNRELRLGLVMTGGVSLAVWMGGVAGEIYRCVKAHGLYGDLAELTATEVIVDVMSGASAGGLNGAFLGTAIAYGLDVDEFDELRDLWLEVGSFSKLIRDPMSKNPPSLLQGDAFFTVKIEEIISKWVARKEGKCVLPDGEKTLTVILMTSLLSAELERFTDDFDTEILEPNHRGMFTFHDEHFRAATLLPSRLALAARTSASFPGAFEASYIPIGEAKPNAAGDRAKNTTSVARPDMARPDMDGIANFPRSHWAVDGGVLVNKPVGPALDAILKRASKSEVRRVVAYINPDPGTPRQAIDVEADVPTLGEVVLKSVVSLPRAESIADHLEELRELNQRNSDKRDLRDALLRGVRVGPAAGNVRRQIDAPEVAEQLYPYWIKQRATDAVDTRLEAHFVKARIDQTKAVTLDTDKTPVTFRELRLALEQARGEQNWLASQLPVAVEPSAGDQALGAPINLCAPDATWRWGFQPLGYIADLVLDLVHRTFALLPLGGSASDVRRGLCELRARVHTERAFLNIMRSADGDYWADSLATLARSCPTIIDCAPKLADYLYRGWPVPPATVWETTAPPSASSADRKRLEQWLNFFNLVVGETDVAKRTQATAEWADSSPRSEPENAVPVVMLRLVDVMEALEVSGEHSPANTELAEKLRARTRATEMRVALELTRIVRDLGDCMAKAININSDRVKTTSSSAPDPCAVLVTDPAVALRDIGLKLSVIVDEPPALRGVVTATDNTQVLAELLRQLLSVYIVHSCTVSNIKETPRLELTQISAFCQNRIAPDRYLPEHKVAGLQVGHFGGFLKRSWRANDWMWGSMDGAERIVAMLVDPARLRQRFISVDEAVDALRPILTGHGRLAQELDEGERLFLETYWEGRESDIRAELAPIFGPPGTPLPKRLDTLCATATYVAQLVICKNQLPVVAQAVVASAQEGGCESIEAVEFVEAVRAVMEPDPRGLTTAERPRRRLSITDVGALLDKCTVGMEQASAELASDLGAATAAKAAAVAATAVSGSHSGLGPLSVPAKSLRTGVLGVYFTTAAALRKTRVGVALTFLLLAIGAGAVSARLLGASVPGPVLAAAILLLAVWLPYTGASAGAWWPSIVGAAVLGVVALSFIEPSAVCTTFARSCTSGAQSGWKTNLPQVVVAALVVVAISCLVTSIRYLFDRSIQKDLELLGAPLLVTRPQRMKSILDSKNRPAGVKQWLVEAVKHKAFKPLVATLVLIFLAVAYPRWIHRAVFDGAPSDRRTVSVYWLVAVTIVVLLAMMLRGAYIGRRTPKHLSAARLITFIVLIAATIVVAVIHGDSPLSFHRADVIRWIETLAKHRSLVTLVGIPTAFIALEYFRTQYQLLRSKSAHSRALTRLRKALATTDDRDPIR